MCGTHGLGRANEAGREGNWWNGGMRMGLSMAIAIGGMLGGELGFIIGLRDQVIWIGLLTGERKYMGLGERCGRRVRWD